MLAIGSDHGGYKFKEEIKRYLEEYNIAYTDIGTNSEESVNYPDIARDVSIKVQNGECDRGILICRSGYGMCIVANKFKGIRCVPAYMEESAKFSKLHNNSNVLALPADYVSVSEAIQILKTWMETEFEGGRHATRVDMITQFENKNMK